MTVRIKEKGRERERREKEEERERRTRENRGGERGWRGEGNTLSP